MNYRIKPGVVTVSMFDKIFLFPSRKANARISAVISLTPELASYLHQQNDCLNFSMLGSESRDKLKRLETLGYIEEY